MENSREKICNTLMPILTMVLILFLSGIVNIVYKLAAYDDMRLPILVAYRFMFGALFIIPIAIISERQKRPKLTAKVVLYSFICGALAGSLGQNLFMKSIDLTTPTFAIAINNIVPGITFILAVCLRLETVRWNKISDQAKVFGTVLGIGGAMVFTFYRGPSLKPGNIGINLLNATTTHHRETPQTSMDHQYDIHNSVIGLILAFVSCFCYSIWLVIQATVHDMYPCPYSFTAMTSSWSAIQGTVYALCVERDWSQWILGWNLRLFTVVFSGIVGTGLVFSMTMWCVKVKGPLFVSVFNPLQMVMVAIAGFLVLEEKLYMGMLCGSILIVCGLYSVLWGKGKEKEVPQNDEENVIL